MKRNARPEHVIGIDSSAAPAEHTPAAGHLPDDAADAPAYGKLLLPQALRPVRPMFPSSVNIILVVEFAERLAFYGVMSVMMPFMRDVKISLPLSNGVANFYSFFAFGACLIGGYIGDSVHGLSKTVYWSCGLMALGCGLLFITTCTQTYPPATGVLDSTETALDGNTHASTLTDMQVFFYAASLVVIGSAAGGIKANVVPLLAHQLEEPPQAATPAAPAVQQGCPPPGARFAVQQQQDPAGQGEGGACRTAAPAQPGCSNCREGGLHRRRSGHAMANSTGAGCQECDTTPAPASGDAAAAAPPPLQPPACGSPHLLPAAEGGSAPMLLPSPPQRPMSSPGSGCQGSPLLSAPGDDTAGSPLMLPPAPSALTGSHNSSGESHGGYDETLSPGQPQGYVRLDASGSVCIGGDPAEGSDAFAIPSASPASPRSSVQPSVFRWVYWCINLGALLGSVCCPLLHLPDGGKAYARSFALPAAGGLVSFVLFGVARHRFKDRAPTKSLLQRAFVAMTRPAGGGVAAGRGAAALQAGGVEAQLVEDVRQTLRACGVFAFFPIYWCVQKQHHTSYVPQADMMNRPDWLPSELLGAINPATLIIGIPVAERHIFPHLEAMGCGNMSRIWIGLVIQTVTIGLSALLQVWIDSRGSYDTTGFHLDEGETRISVSYQILPYVLTGVGEIFASVGGLEFAYSAAPATMKSLVMSIYLLTSGLGSFIGVLYSPFMAPEAMASVFFVMTGMMGGASLIFYAVYRAEMRREGEFSHIGGKDRGGMGLSSSA